jgi:site-specific DNA recombinase
MSNFIQIKDLDFSIPRPKRACAYARVSTELEEQMTSYSAQIDHYSKLIKGTPGWVFAGMYADLGVSGTRADRPGFSRLMVDCEEGKIDIIITKSISRFARNTLLLLSSIRRLKEIGVSVRFEREGIDTMTSDGELMLTLLATFAQEESLSISENTKWSIRKGFEKGIGNQFTRMYGFKWNGKEFETVPEEAENVKLIFRSYLEGSTPDRIAKMLNAKGAKPVKGGRFSYESVWLILRQIKYTGSSLLQKTFKESHLSHRTVRNRGELPMYLAEGTHPVIIERELFDKVQAEIAARKALGFRAGRPGRFSCFTSLIVCPFCGRTYRRKTYSHPGHDDHYAKWVCSTKIDKGAKGCQAFGLPEKALLRMTAEALGEEKADPEAVKQRILRITVHDHHAVFKMADGQEKDIGWEDERKNSVYRRSRKDAGR